MSSFNFSAEGSMSTSPEDFHASTHDAPARVSATKRSAPIESPHSPHDASSESEPMYWETEWEMWVQRGRDNADGSRARATKRRKLMPGHKEGPTINKAPTRLQTVYTFGAGSDGHLGQGPGKPDEGYRSPNLDFEINRRNPAQVAFGRDHSVLLTKDGDVMTWGDNYYHALGRPTLNGNHTHDCHLAARDQESLYRRIPKFMFNEARDVNFTAVAATDFASYALTEDGFVYGWGMHCGNDGVLNITRRRATMQWPCLVPALSKITKIAAGSNHMLALDTDGNVHAWGAGDVGQLGRRLTQRHLVGGLRQSRCLTGKNVDRIFAGGRTSYAIAKDGRVFVWGNNSDGQCGLPGNFTAEITKPTVSWALTNAKIHTIAAGKGHAIGITAEGSVMAWGRCDQMQLGSSSAEISLGVKRGEVLDDFIVDERNLLRAVTVPILVDRIYGATSVAAGHHTGFAVDGLGRMWSWGSGQGFGHGMGHTRDVQARLVPMGGKRVTWVAGSRFFGAAGRSEPVVKQEDEDE